MKRYISTVLLFLFIFSFFSGIVYAKEKPNDIPEVDGVYNDPTHPGIKVRVFVHKGKPGPAPQPILNCTLTDPDSTAVVNITGWKLPSNWTYNLNPSSVPSSVGSDNLANIADLSFSEWQSSSKNAVRFNRGSDTKINKQAYDGKNIIAWGRTSGSALAVTYIRYDSSGIVVDIDTIMNLKFSWAWSNQTNCAYSGVYDAQNILTHELGHWMGLNDEYSSIYSNNTMYGYGAKQEVKKDTLTSGDINGLLSIY